MITAREAFEKGLLRYFTGRPCIYGHTAERMISNGSCIECLKNKKKFRKKAKYDLVEVWRAKHPNKKIEQARRYRNKHPEKVKSNSQRYINNNRDKVRESNRISQSKLRKSNPEKERQRNLRYREKKNKEKELLAGRPKSLSCEICSEINTRIVFDHCHKTGKFRGWICDRCNKVLGLVKDYDILLQRLVYYLKENNDDKNNI